MVKASRVTAIRLMAFYGLALTLFLEGCDHDPRVDGMQRQLQDMTKNLDELKKQVETLKSDSSWDRFARDLEGVAYMTPGDSGYSVVKTDFGPLTVTLEDIKPYANGLKRYLVKRLQQLGHKVMTTEFCSSDDGHLRLQEKLQPDNG